ncbi:class I SAM-dependent methyltransferase [Selenomonas sp.]|uniref:class I SAM-dependent methyltransferase n=1 Tax=Selenomonas sp. TaxID=2053611 RepID=UPI003FA29138
MKTQEMLAKEEALEKRIESYWDKRSPAFSDVRRRELAGVDAALWQQLIERRLPEGSPLRVLDVGTGAGFFAILFSRLRHTVTGIDMSAGMLAEAQKNLEAFGCRAELRKMNAQQLDFSDASFDVVISRNLTWTLPDAMQAYREWHRVLKAGGILLNFDSDCGETTFSATGDQACVHAGIGEALIAECNAIKDELRISTHRRPIWDMGLLTALGFSVQVDADIAPLVHGDDRLHYDDVPLFGIYAKKVR